MLQEDVYFQEAGFYAQNIIILEFNLPQVELQGQFGILIIIWLKNWQTLIWRGLPPRRPPLNSVDSKDAQYNDRASILANILCKH